MVRLMFVTDFTEQFAYRLLKGILDYSKGKEPWTVMRVPVEYKMTGFENLVNWAVQWKINVVIGLFDEENDLELFRKKGIVVLAQDYVKKFNGYPNITSDYTLTGRMAAEHFIEKGFQNFGFFGHNNVCWSDDRRDAYTTRLKEQGFKKIYVYNGQSLNRRWFYTANTLKKWILSLPKPIAIMCCDDNQGNLLLEACNSIGVRVPDEVSIIGVDNDEILDNMTAPTLSSIDLDIERGGWEAAEMATRMMKDPCYRGEDIILHPIDIKTRISSSIFATKDTAILKALQFIQSNLEDKISVSDVLKVVPLSRRLLEIRFKEVTGDTIYNYISRLRIERFAYLLLNTGDSVLTISEKLGEIDSKSISRKFKAIKGCTPLEYRNCHQDKSKSTTAVPAIPT